MAAWIYDASPDYFDLLFGDRATSLGVIHGWTGRDDSEYSTWGATLAFDEGDPAGIAVMFGPDQLLRRRRADLLRLLKSEPSSRRGDAARKLAMLSEATAPIEASHMYLRVLAVDPEHRGRGLGSALLDDCIARAGTLGYKRLRLDVMADNTPAVRLYERAGFNCIHDRTTSNGWRLLSLVSPD